MSRHRSIEVPASLKADVLADIAQAEADVPEHHAAVERERAAFDAVAARATALEGQIERLQADRGAGLDEAQAALTQFTLAGDTAGAAAAAESVARIDDEAAAIAARLRPLQLQLQLAEVNRLKDAAGGRVEEAERAHGRAEAHLSALQLEAKALQLDEAAIAFREACIAYEFAAAGRRRPLHVEFSIGTSTRLLAALGRSEPIAVTDGSIQQMRQAAEPIGESIFGIDPMKLEDFAAMQARERAEPRHRPEKLEKARLADSYASAKGVNFATACERLGFVDMGFNVDELAGLRTALA